MNDAAPSLVISGLTIERGGRKVVHGVDIVARPGEITALLGPNGAGKSSLVLALAGTLPARSGSVTLNGEVVSGRTRPRCAQQAWQRFPKATVC